MITGVKYAIPMPGIGSALTFYDSYRCVSNRVNPFLVTNIPASNSCFPCYSSHIAYVQLLPPPNFLSLLLAFLAFSCVFCGVRSAWLPANLVQAQRDYFGAHKYEKIGEERGKLFHTDWYTESPRVTARARL